MRDLDGRIVLSASDLMRFMGCAHATTLDLAHMRGTGPQPRQDSEDAALLQKQGDAHEAAHLARLKNAGRTVIEIERSGLGNNAEATRAALVAGADVVFQGAFLSGSWGGWSDFLERVDRPSALGPFSYEVADTKLKRRLHPKHVLQLVLYSDLLTEVQGAAPEFAHVELGDGTRATLRLSDYAAYARMAQARLEGFVADPPPTRPIPCSDCDLCRWADHCADVWQATDSLFNVANISRGQVKKLEAAGIQTMEALARLDHPVSGMAEHTRLRLVSQARLQHARKTGMPAFELRTPEPGKGFDLLPEPQAGDLFYDIEGDPHFEGGLEYLYDTAPRPLRLSGRQGGEITPERISDHDPARRRRWDDPLPGQQVRLRRLRTQTTMLPKGTGTQGHAIDPRRRPRHGARSPGDRRRPDLAASAQEGRDALRALEAHPEA